MECGSFDPCPLLGQRLFNVKCRTYNTYCHLQVMQSTGALPDAAGETTVARRRVGNIELDAQGFWTDHKSGAFGLCPLVSAGVRRCPRGIRPGWLVRADLVRGLFLSRCPLHNSFEVIDFGLVRVSGHKNALSAPKVLKSKVSDLFLLGAWVTRSMFFCLAIWVPASRVCLDLCSCGIVLTP